MGTQGRKKNFRKRKVLDGEGGADEEEPADVRSTLEEVRLLQKLRDRTKGMAADAHVHVQVQSTPAPKGGADVDAEGGEELVLQDTFAQETAVIVEDPNMVKYVEQELARKRGLTVVDQGEDTVDPEAELYKVPDHLKVKKRAADEGTAAWTTGIAEVQLPIEFKLKNIEETEAAKKVLQERRPLIGRQRAAETLMPASYSADYFQRGREFAAKLRRDPPPQDKGPGGGGGGRGSAAVDPQGEHRRQAATDEIMLERFRKRERNRLRR